MAYGLYQRTFYESDRNHDGLLDRNEFQNFREFENADRNHDGRVSFPEFARSAGKWRPLTGLTDSSIILAPELYVPPRQTLQAFRTADINHDGVLNRQELANFADFQRADMNHDGRIDPYEMRQYLGSNFAMGADPCKWIDHDHVACLREFSFRFIPSVWFP